MHDPIMSLRILSLSLYGSLEKDDSQRLVEKGQCSFQASLLMLFKGSVMLYRLIRTAQTTIMGNLDWLTSSQRSVNFSNSLNMSALAS